MADEGDWVLIGLDERLARKQGVPAKVPVPKAEFEALADKGMSIDQVREWVGKFMQTAPAARSQGWRTDNAALVKTYESFLAKKDGWAKAQQAFAKSDFKGALGALRLICNIDKDDHAARLNLASALANTGDHAKALEHLDAIADTWSDDADYHVTRANVLLSLQRRDDAIGALVAALDVDPSCQAALDTLKGLGVLVAIYENPRDAASLIYVRSDSVVEHLESVWGAEPRDLSFWLEQIAYHELDRRPAVVLAAAEHASRVGATPDPRVTSARIGALRDLGRNAEALALARAHSDSHRSSDSLVDLARCLIAANDPDEAQRCLDRALADDPGHLMAIDLRFWPRDRHDLQQVQEAIPHLQAHVDAHGTSAGAWRSIARARLAIGDADAALAMFEKAVALDPDDDGLRAEWWQELARHGKHDAVLADAAKIGDIKTRDWKLRWNEAEAYQAAGKRIEAQAAFASLVQDESLHVDVRKRAKRAAMGAGAEK